MNKNVFDLEFVSLFSCLAFEKQIKNFKTAQPYFCLKSGFQN